MQTQIDMHLFVQLWTYFYELENRSPEEQKLFEELDIKADKIIARELFSRFKRAPSAEERNSARLEYMRHVNSTRFQ